MSDMKKKLSTTFDELIKNRYGITEKSVVSNTEKIEDLFANYYGKPSSFKIKNIKSSIAISLSHDDGELLSQKIKSKRFEEYVTQYSIEDAECENIL